MNITLFLDSKNKGGIETHVANLAEALTAQSHRVKVIVWKRYDRQDHPLQNMMQKANIPFYYADGALSQLIRYVEKGSILHTHGYKANLLGKLGHTLGAWHCIPTHHNGDVGTGLLKLYVQLDELSSRWFSPISVSNEIYHRLGSRGIKLKNFLSYLPSLDIKGHHTKHIAFVGRISDEKDPEHFCQLAKTMVQKHSTLSFHLYGEGHARQALTEHYPEVTFYGEQPMENHWQTIDLLCLTSKTEGLPLAALEAMSRGIPVLSYDVGDLSELIEHGATGWVVEKRDQSEPSMGMIEILQKWETMALHEKKRFRKQSQARIHQHYSAQSVLPKLLAHYHA
ncbi:glycosyltransferase family 4 protein [Marinomonas algicola]|uniref:glycosyltransferase family 4 protein n=1 Tax=Marinomonas algicola TaxID=2773454 RepID=UPI00174DF709|nr:glycosyltransferase family 4 protein [Marinomonas algicola]